MRLTKVGFRFLVEMKKKKKNCLGGYRYLYISNKWQRSWLLRERLSIRIIRKKQKKKIAWFLWMYTLLLGPGAWVCGPWQPTIQKNLEDCRRNSSISQISKVHKTKPNCSCNVYRILVHNWKKKYFFFFFHQSIAGQTGLPQF